MAGSALSLAYGLPIRKNNDPLIDLAQRAVSAMNVSVLASNFLVNILPILKYVPEFFPGAGFKKKAREWKKLQEDLVNRPFEMVESQVVRPVIWLFCEGFSDKKIQKAGTANHSFTASSLQRMAESNEQKWAHEREIIKDSAGSLFVGAYVLLRSL